MATTDDNRALVPSQERPTFTADELALVDSSAYAALDAEDDAVAAARNAISSGLFTPAEAKKHWGLSDAEAAEISKPRTRSRQPTELQRIDAEIAKIDALRKSDRRTYWADSTQKRIEDLYRERALVAAGVTSAMPADVVDEWERTGGVEHRAGLARATAQRALDALDDDEQSELQASFDSALPETVKSVLYKFMAVEPSGRWRTARPDELARFRDGSDDGAALVREWGDHAARNLGIARGRIEMMARAAKSKEDRDAGLAWFDNLPSNQFRAVVNALLP